jgi:hypothetical protein
MDKEKVKIRKLMLMSPEYYDRIKKRPQIPINLLDIEKGFLDIFKEKNLSSTQKLALYNNLFTVTMNAKNKILHLPSGKNSVENDIEKKPTTVETSSSPFKEEKSTQTERRLVYRRKAQDDTFLPAAASSPIKKVPEETLPPALSFKLPSVKNLFIENAKDDEDQEEYFGNDAQVLNVPLKQNFEANDEIDLSGEKQSFLENLRRASGVKTIDTRDFSFKNFEDPAKGYVLARNKASNDLLTIEKPSQKRPSKRSTKSRAAANDPESTPKAKRAKKNPTRVDTPIPPSDFPSAWATYERHRLRGDQ